MRYAIISDIHANLEAFRSVLGEIDGGNADRIICLGDIVGYGADPNE
ncbi:MAG: metallophosphoesterase, partial [Candidatus Dadabacteria bacterium]|nr:metallophosphoesterase [Candidatus Dadabacteria bacterium]